MSYYGKGDKGAATELHSKIVRARYGRCLHCGVWDDKPGFMQAAHVLGRSASWTRTWSPNLICLCAPCHARFENDPPGFTEALKAMAGDRYDEWIVGLWRRRDCPFKMNWAEERVAVEAELWLENHQLAKDLIRQGSLKSFEGALRIGLEEERSTFLDPRHADGSPACLASLGF